MLNIKNLTVKRENKTILNGLDLKVQRGEVHIVMGPNGSGKSTLAGALMGMPDVEVLPQSKITIDNKDLLEMSVDQRAKEGLFLAFQYPVEVSGVPFSEFLRLSYNNIQQYRKGDEFRPLSPFKFKKILQEKMNDLKIDETFLSRNLNEGFSGGEKKKSEILQMSVMEPKYAILDETDSGLDVTALKIVSENAQRLSEKMNIGLVVITHYSRILKYINPDYVHVLIKGQIVKTGGKELAEVLDSEGYDKYSV